VAEDVGHAPGLVRRGALRTYRWLPRRLRLLLLRTFAPTFTVGALCFVEDDGRVLMLRQRHRIGWTLPGGLLDRGESAEQAVVRELAEETGLTVEVGVPLGVVVEPRARRVDVIYHIPVVSTPDVVPSSEAVRAAWLRPDELGSVDESTAQAFALFVRARRPGARDGRLSG
jgi:ADP-ribose pyrophosphatase YjhB (NUDIX family)